MSMSGIGSSLAAFPLTQPFNLFSPEMQSGNIFADDGPPNGSVTNWADLTGSALPADLVGMLQQILSQLTALLSQNQGQQPLIGQQAHKSNAIHKTSHHQASAAKASHSHKSKQLSSTTKGRPQSTLSQSQSSIPRKTGNKTMDRWDTQIEAAAKSTGLPANYIKATIWAESNGNSNDPSKNPDGKHTDLGVMQESNYTYGDVMKDQPHAPRGLNAANPADNIMMGAWELKDKYEQAGGNLAHGVSNAMLQKTSEAYRGHGDSGDTIYAKNVLTYMSELNNGQKLSQDPHGNPDQ